LCVIFNLKNPLFLWKNNLVETGFWPKTVTIFTHSVPWSLVQSPDFQIDSFYDLKGLDNCHFYGHVFPTECKTYWRICCAEGYVRTMLSGYERREREGKRERESIIPKLS
jgi:hypothetical protein